MPNDYPTPKSTPAQAPGGLTAALPPTFRHRGRLLDSTDVDETEQFPLPLRARFARVTADSIVMSWGCAVAEFNRARLIARLDAGEQRTAIWPNGETYMFPDHFFDARQSAWIADFQDTHGPLPTVDVDDRGVAYPAYTLWGFGGVVGDPGTYPMRSLYQVLSPPETGAINGALAFTTGGERYVIASGSGGGASALYRETPVGAEMVRSISVSVRFSAKGNGTVGVLGFDGHVRIFTPDGLLAATHLFKMPVMGGLSGIATDGETYYVTSYAPGSTTLHILSPSGGTYSHREAAMPFAFSQPRVSVGAGLIAVFGQDQAARGADLHLLRADDLIGIPTNRFFADYYSRNFTEGFVTPQGAGLDTNGGGADVALFVEAGKRYLVALANTLCDLFEVVADGSAPMPPPTPTPPPVTPPLPPPTPQPPPIIVPPAPPPPVGKPVMTTQNTYIGDLVDSAKTGELVYMRCQTVGYGLTDEVVTWTFGDGSPAEVSIATDQTGSVRHTWPVAGSYNVTMTVRRGGQSITGVQNIVIRQAGVVVDPLPPPVDPPPPPPVDPPVPPPVEPPVPEPPSPPLPGPSVGVEAVRAHLAEAKTAAYGVASMIERAMTILDAPPPPPPALRMRLGVCETPEAKYGWTRPQPTLESWQALRRGVGVTDMRLIFDLALVSSTPGAWEPSLFALWARLAHEAGIRIHANVVIGSFDAVQFVKPPPAHHTPALRRELAARLVTEFGDIITSYALGNEPGDSNVWWMQDDLLRGGSRDGIRTVYFPDFIIPVHDGIRSVNPTAIITGFESDHWDIQVRCMDAAKEDDIKIDAETVHPYGDVNGGDYATTELFRAPGHHGPGPWAIGEIDHQQFPGAMNRFPTDEEIGKLADFSRMVVTKYPDCQGIYFGSPEFFFTREPNPNHDDLLDFKGNPNMLLGVKWSTWTYGAPVVSDAGRKLADVFRATASGKRRAVTG